MISGISLSYIILCSPKGSSRSLFPQMPAGTRVGHVAESVLHSYVGTDSAKDPLPGLGLQRVVCLF